MDPAIWKVELGHGMGPLELGTERSIILARLREMKVEVETDEDEPTWTYLDEIDTQLTFSADPPQRLVQIEVDDDRVRFGTLPVLGEPVHKIVEFLQIPPAETLWRPGEDPALSMPGQDGPLPEAKSDDELLHSGTLWITTLGLGLSLWRGDVDAVYLRQPQDSPRSGLGQFSSEQVELMQSGGPRLKQATAPEEAPEPSSWFRTFYRWAFFLIFILLGWQAVRYQQRWNAAPTTEGTIVAVKPPPPDVFPVEFTVAYQDQQGKEHQALFSLSDVNESRRVGDKVDVRYLADDPDVAMGLASSRDAVIITFIPWVVGLVIAFVALQFVPWIAEYVISKVRSPVTEEK
jgi:hypothetical protein